jgi:hypothetical protein
MRVVVADDSLFSRPRRGRLVVKDGRGWKPKDAA